jgi:hypothetical protein
MIGSEKSELGSFENVLSVDLFAKLMTLPKYLSMALPEAKLEESDCYSCKMSLNESSPVQLPCRHVFHKSCIEEIF